MNEEWANEGPLVEEVGIDWSGVREAFKDPKIYVSSVSLFSLFVFFDV